MSACGRCRCGGAVAFFRPLVVLTTSDQERKEMPAQAFAPLLVRPHWLVVWSEEQPLFAVCWIKGLYVLQEK